MSKQPNLELKPIHIHHTSLPSSNREGRENWEGRVTD